MAFLDENGVAQFWAAVKDRLAGAFDNVEFDIAEQAANLVSGDSIATAFGKLAKNYTLLLTSISDLNTNLTSQINTKLNKSDVLANYTTTATGKALDASLGPAIKTNMDLADTLNTRVTALDSKFVVQYVQGIAPVDDNGIEVTRIVKNTNKWMYFPVTKTGYSLMGILGYYLYANSPNETSYYSHVNIYHIMPTNNKGVAMAIACGENGDWIGPRGAFELLWQKA